MTKRLIHAFALVGSVYLCPAVQAQSSDAGWLDSLRIQMIVDENCEVQFFLNIQERERATGNTYSARVQCKDGRQFDATRTDPETDFTIATCGQAVC